MTPGFPPPNLTPSVCHRTATLSIATHSLWGLLTCIGLRAVKPRSHYRRGRINSGQRSIIYGSRSGAQSRRSGVVVRELNEQVTAYLPKRDAAVVAILTFNFTISGSIRSRELTAGTWQCPVADRHKAFAKVLAWERGRNRFEKGRPHIMGHN